LSQLSDFRLDLFLVVDELPAEALDLEIKVLTAGDKIIEFIF